MPSPPPPPPPYLHPPSIIAHPPLPRHGPDYLPRGNPLVHWRAAPSDVQNTQDPRRPDIRRFYLTNYLNKLHQDGAPLPPEPPETPPLEPAENGPIGPHGLPVRKYPAALFHSEKTKNKKHGCSANMQPQASFRIAVSSAKWRPLVNNFDTAQFHHKHLFFGLQNLLNIRKIPICIVSITLLPSYPNLPSNVCVPVFHCCVLTVRV